MKHIFYTAIKNIKSIKKVSIFNLIGLVTAFTATLIIMLYVWSEYHFDRYHADADDIYRIEIKAPNDEKTSVYMSGQTKDVIKSNVPEVVATTTYMPWGKWGETLFKAQVNNKEIESFEDYGYADEQLTEIFAFNFVRKTGDKPLSAPNSVIISKEFATKLWGTTDVIGKTIENNNEAYTITGIFNKPPKNSIFDAPIIMHIPTKGWLAESYNEWGIVNFPEFIKVKKGTKLADLQAKIDDISILREKYNYLEKRGKKGKIIARPLTQLRFAKDVAENPLFNTNNKSTVNTLFAIGIFISLIALLNYINFSTATLPKRMKSVAVSRIIGSNKSQVIASTIVEGLIVFMVSFGIALGLASLINDYFGIKLYEYKLTFDIVPIAIIGITVALIGIVASLISAFAFTKINPVYALKKSKTSSKSLSRGVLTVVQFAASIILIAISTLIVKQVIFMKNAPLGFNKENVMVIPMNMEIYKNKEAFVSQLKTSPFLKSVSLSGGVPGIPANMEGFRYKDEAIQTWLWNIDEEYIPMMGINIAEGRNFIKDSESDMNNIIANKAAAKKFGLNLGTIIQKGDDDGNLANYEIVGIIDDFNYSSLREKVEPFVFRYSKGYLNVVNIKVDANNIKKAIAFVENEHDKMFSEKGLRYFFLDDKLQVLYSKEDQQAKLVTIFSFLSLIISSLGILGLAIFTSQYRTKEIGIRKVNGATISEILRMLNKDFIKWILISFVMATPIAYFAMNRWLQSFAYKTALSWWIFALAGIIALAIALLTVSWQSWRAASRNPVEALRYE